MTTKIFKVSGMTCGGCVRTVQNLLNNENGVEKADVSLDSGAATVTYNELVTSPETMAKTIGKMGYTFHID